ncbi:MAG TPA: sulfotransferase [Acidimicrobiales bacterium]
MTTRRFNRQQLVDAAVERTGLDDLGEPTWQEGLDRLLDDLGDSARLNDVGVVLVETETVNYLSNRLGIVAWRASHPGVSEQAVARPVVICGQPRTGTTILYDLLALDRSHRAPLTWEVDSPCPPPATATFETDPRIDESQAVADMADVLIPGFSTFHPLGARLAQECVRITASDFRSMIFPTQYEVPQYDRWLLHEADMAPAYRWHRAFLQHLQSGHAGDRWLLKSPAHLWHLGALMAEYPDAVVIQTHRDPLKVIASVSALAAHLRRMASDSPSVAAAATQYSDDIFVGLDRSMAARADGTLPAGQVIDVQFGDFMADPFRTIGLIYDQLGTEFTADAEARMREFLAGHPGDGGGGGSRYSFVDTGLDPGQLRERARGYQEFFGVVSEDIV